jgi:hypothetical protein
VKHLSPCFANSDDIAMNSMTSSFQPRVTDVGGSESVDVELSVHIDGAELLAVGRST